MSSEASFDKTQTIAMVAGEASGDLLASGLLAHLQALHWPIQVEGVAGPKMMAQGMQALHSADRLAVRGYWEVLKHYRALVGMRNGLIERWSQQRPSVFIGVDAPDFNLHLALRLRQQGVPTVQYVCPAVWAWRPERLKLMKQALDHVWCLFPFEPELLAQADIDSTYVGHPLAQWIPELVDVHAARIDLGCHPERPVLVLMPGSRTAELDGLLPRFLHATQMLVAQHTGLQVVVPTLPRFLSRVTQAVQAIGLQDQVRVIEGQSHLALAAASVVMVASGTATLEAALFKKPMVIAYHMPWISWQITQRKKRLPWVGLPNILARDFLVPELIQNDCVPDALAREVSRWLLQPDAVDRLATQLMHLHQSLKRPTHECMAETLKSWVLDHAG
jgi:lipid-A-disaccharide synthase